MITQDVCSMLDAAIMNMPTGLFIVDIRGHVVFINKAYAAYLSIRPEEAVGRHITELIPDSRIVNVLKTGQPDFGAIRQLSISKRRFLTNRYPLYNAEGDLMGAMSMVVLDKPDQLLQMQRQIDTLTRQAKRYARRLRAALEAHYTVDSIIGSSRIMQDFKRTLLRFARAEEPILVWGPTGTGKELAASAIHNASPRSDGPFVCLNCAAIPQELFESELFGYAPGAFSGASKDGKEGQIELADKGTLFLDEVGDLPLRTQVKLLRVLEERVVRRIGDGQGRPVDFRLVTATNRELGKMVVEGSFRQDLFYRINSMVLTLPPLQDRLEDIPELVAHFLERTENVTCSARVLELFRHYSWPGNIRELKNVLSYALSLVDGNVIDTDCVPSSLVMSVVLHGDGEKDEGRLEKLRATSERNAILTVLRENGWNVTRTAKILGISRANIYEKMRKLGIHKKYDTEKA